MRILVTGFTPLQLASPNAGKRAQKINVPAALVAMLREQGHEVDWRIVEVGETVEDEFDLQLINMSGACSLNGRVGALGSLWAMSRPLPTICHFDDWQFANVFNNLKRIVERGYQEMTKLLNGGEYFYKGNARDPELKHCAVEIVRVAEGIRKTWDRWLALCPCYPWGDKEALRQRMRRLPRENFSFFDPSSLVIDEYKGLNWSVKERAWSCASLMPHDYWLERQQFTWPIYFFGTNKKDVREGKTTTLATENAVREEYARRWGVLSPEYPQSGSGWFRSRFVYAAQVGSVLYCGPKDGAQLGSAYLRTIAEIEKASDEDLDEMARRQQETLITKLWSRDELVVAWDAIVERAVRLSEGVPA